MFSEFRKFKFVHESEGYSPGHPWYYKTGGKPFLVDEILPYNPADEKTRNQFGSFLDCGILQAKSPNEGVDYLERVICRNVDKLNSFDERRYQALIDMGLEGFLADHQPIWGAEDDPIYYYQALGLKYGHITYARTTIAIAEWKIQQIKQSGGYQKALF